MNREKLSTNAFYIAMLLELVVSFSGYLFGGYGETAIIFAGMGMSALAILLSYDYKNMFKRSGIIDIAIYGVIIIYALLCFYFQKSALVLRIALPLIAARCLMKNDENKDLPEKVLKIFFFGTLAVMLVAVLLALFGIHNSMSVTDNFRNEVETRYKFGFYRPNGFALFYFRVFILGMYLYTGKLKAWLVPVLALVLVTPLYLANSKMALAGYVLVVALALFARFVKGKPADVIILVIGYIVIACILLLIVNAPKHAEILARHDKVSELWGRFNDELLSGRMHGMYNSFQKYNVNLFGYGAGLDTTENGFVNSLFTEGLILQIIFFVSTIVLLFKKFKKNDRYAMIFIIGMFAYNFAEAFLPYFNKNLVWMMMM